MCCSPSAIRMSFSWVMPPMPDPSVRMKCRLVWMSGCTDDESGLCDDGSSCGWVCGTW